MANEAQQKIEGMYQRAMDLRDATPVRDNWPASDLAESKYRKAYLKAYKRTHDVGAFRKATREYRRFLRDGQ